MRSPLFQWYRWFSKVVIKLNSRTIVTLESSDCHEEKVKLNCSFIPSWSYDPSKKQNGYWYATCIFGTHPKWSFFRWENHHGNGTFKGTDPADLFVKESDHWLCGKTILASLWLCPAGSQIRFVMLHFIHQCPSVYICIYKYTYHTYLCIYIYNNNY